MFFSTYKIKNVSPNLSKTILVFSINPAYFVRPFVREVLTDLIWRGSMRNSTNDPCSHATRIRDWDSGGRPRESASSAQTSLWPYLSERSPPFGTRINQYIQHPWNKQLSQWAHVYTRWTWRKTTREMDINRFRDEVLTICLNCQLAFLTEFLNGS